MSREERGLTVICSGSHGKPSLEDLCCAGALVKAILALRDERPISLDKMAKNAIEVFESTGDTGIPRHRRTVGIRIHGFRRGPARAAAVDSLDVVPVFDGKAIVAINQR